MKVEYNTELALIVSKIEAALDIEDSVGARELFNKNLEQLKQLEPGEFQLLRGRILSIILPSSGAGAGAAVPTPTPRPSSLAPIGIERKGYTCPEIALCQLLLDCPSITARIKTGPLKGIIDGLRRSTRSPVPAGIPIALREWIAPDLDLRTQSDPMDGLMRILEEYGEDVTRDEFAKRHVQLQLRPGKTPFNDLLAEKPIIPGAGSLIYAVQHTCPRTQRKIQGIITHVPRQLIIGPVHYHLQGCVIHSGEENNGHYTYLKRVGDAWVHIDDHKVKPIANPEALLSRGCIFNYQKEMDLSEPMGMPPARTCGELAARVFQIGYTVIATVAQLGIEGGRSVFRSLEGRKSK